MEDVAVGTLAVNGLLIIIIVFAALLLLWFIVAMMSKIIRKVETGEETKKPRNPRLTRLYIALTICTVAVAILLPIGITLLTK